MTAPRLIPVVMLRERSVYAVSGTGAGPAVFYIADRDAGGILVNSPSYDPEVARRLSDAAPLRFLFYPSRFGARDVERWRATGAESLASAAEAPRLGGRVDVVLDGKNKLTRTIDFLPMSGRTRGSCALRLRNLPGAMFFGPILSVAPSGWPGLVPMPDDDSYENRLFGVLGLRDLKFDYAFTDDFVPGQTCFGPGADKAIQREIESALGV